MVVVVVVLVVVLLVVLVLWWWWWCWCHDMCISSMLPDGGYLAQVCTVEDLKI